MQKGWGGPLSQIWPWRRLSDGPYYVFLKIEILLMQKGIKYIANAKGIRYIANAKGIRYITYKKGIRDGPLSQIWPRRRLSDDPFF